MIIVLHSYPFNILLSCFSFRLFVIMDCRTIRNNLADIPNFDDNTATFECKVKMGDFEFSLGCETTSEALRIRIVLDNCVINSDGVSPLLQSLLPFSNIL